MKDIRDLEVWHVSHGWAVQVYSITSKFPGEELARIKKMLPALIRKIRADR